MAKYYTRIRTKRMAELLDLAESVGSSFLFGFFHQHFLFLTLILLW